MKYTISIDQGKSLQWWLNLSQASVFSIIYQASGWAEEVVVCWKVYYRIAENKICKELPLVSMKPDTIQKITRILRDKWLLDYIQVDNKKCYALTEEAKTWNSTEIRVTEKNPWAHGKKSVRATEKNPSNKNTIKDNNTIDNLLSEEEQALPVPEYWKKDINDLIEIIKEACKKNGFVYSWKWDNERRAAWWILSKKFLERIAEFNMSLDVFVNNIVMLSSRLKYNSKQVTSARLLYYNREEIVNKGRLQQINSNADNPYSDENVADLTPYLNSNVTKRD